MEKKLISLLAAATLLYCICTEIEQHRVPENCKEVIAVHTVQPGETMWTIADDYFDAGAEKNYNAFQYRVQADNALLIANGRQLQVGDQLYIRYYVNQ